MGTYFYEHVSIFRVHCLTCVRVTRIKCRGRLRFAAIVCADVAGKRLHVDLGGGMMMSRLSRRPR